MITFTKNIKFYDEEGIPVTFFYYTGKKIYAHPTSIAQWGLASIQKYLRTHQIRHLASFKKACEWFVKKGLQQDGALFFPLNFDHPAYCLKKPWRSAMTQGEAVSLLVRGFLYFKKNKYLKAAEDAFKSFEKAEWGMLVHDKHGYWLEEVPSQPPSHILNGMIFAMYGIYDLFLATKKNFYLDFFKKVANTLAENLQLYDLGYWSRYDLLFGLPASKIYHSLHIQQLASLYYITSNEIFRKYYQLFQNYLRPYNRYKTDLVCGVKSFSLNMRRLRKKLLGYYLLQVKLRALRLI